MMSLFMFLLSSPEVPVTLKKRVIQRTLRLIPLSTHLMVIEKNPIGDTVEEAYRYACIKNKVGYVGYLTKGEQEGHEQIETSFPLYGLKEREITEYLNVILSLMISFEHAWNNYLEYSSDEAVT